MLNLLFFSHIGYAQNTLHVFAAVSLKNALDEVAQNYTHKTSIIIKTSYAASSVLAHQIEQEAPADVFISADEDWMDYLETRHFLLQDSRIKLLGNHLVVVAPFIAKIDTVELSSDALLNAIGDGKLALGEVNSVPAGKYARQALQNLKLWEGLKLHIAQSDNVRAALAFVARGEAPLGIVYESDTHAEPQIKIVAKFADSSHKPIIYPLALTKNASKESADFVSYLQSAEAMRIFLAAGFDMP